MYTITLQLTEEEALQLISQSRKKGSLIVKIAQGLMEKNFLYIYGELFSQIQEILRCNLYE